MNNNEKQPMQTWSHSQLIAEIEKLKAELERVKGIAKRLEIMTCKSCECVKELENE